MSGDSGTVDLAEQIRSCTRCGLCSSMPFKPVPGFGPLNARIMLVGEAPGEDESIIEEPFVGLAGRMLDKLLLEAGLDRSTLYIANVVNCRPTEGKKNRPPSRTEIKACQHWLFKQIDLVNPQVIFTLGKIPTYTVLGLKPTFKLHDYIGVVNSIDLDGQHRIVIPNLHPSYVMVYGKKEVSLAIETFKKGLYYV